MYNMMVEKHCETIRNVIINYYNIYIVLLVPSVCIRVRVYIITMNDDLSYFPAMLYIRFLFTRTVDCVVYPRPLYKHNMIIIT